MILWDRELAWRFLKNPQKGRFFSVSFWVAVLGMSFGVMALLLSLSITDGFKREYERAILGSQAHVMLNSEDDIENPEVVREEIRKNSQEMAIPVQKVHSIVYREGMLIGGKTLKGVVLKGVSLPQYFEDSGIKIVRTSEKNSGNLPEIYLGKSAAGETGLTSGVVRLLFPQNTQKISDVGLKDMKMFFLAGVFETGVYELDSSFALLDLKVAQDFFHLGNAVSGFELWLDSPQHADNFSRQMREKLVFPFDVVSWREVNENIFKAMETEKWMFGLLMGVLIVIASLNILGTLMMLLLKKRREVALLRALGYSWSRLRKIFLLDGLLIGSVGIFSGIIMSVVFIQILKKWQPIRLDPEIYFLKTVPVVFSWGHIFWVVGVSVAICSFGCLLTLRKISHTATVKGLLER